jgi:hypothetical protein
LSGQTDKGEKGENAFFHLANLVIVGWVVKKNNVCQFGYLSLEFHCLLYLQNLFH